MSIDWRKTLKLMIASDLHGSAYYCKKMLDCYEKERADRLILLGDLLYHGPRNDLPRDYCPKEVIHLLNQRKNQILCVRGNCEAEVDQMVLEFPVMAEYAIFSLDSRMIFATHGHVFHERNLPPLQPGDILLHGHTHIWAAEKKSNYIYLNPGSISIPKNGNVPTYMIYENHCFIIKDLKGTEVKRLDLTDPISSLKWDQIHSTNATEAFDQFCQIVKQLRAENGCPWDRAQTHESLKTCMIEEAYEVVEAIHRLSETKDTANLKEELGDVLLQVVLHSQIASEEGIFELKGVIDEINKKMIRRHPHVFGSQFVPCSDQVVANWEELKRQEKKEKGLEQENELESIPKAFPALIRAQKLLKKSGADQDNSVKDVLKTIQENLEKLENEKEIDRQAVIGSLLMDVANLASHYHINGEEALAETVANRIKSFK